MLSLLRPSISNVFHTGIRRSYIGPQQIIVNYQRSLVQSISSNSIRCFSQQVKSKTEAILRKAKYLSQEEIDELAKEIRKRRNRDTLFYLVGFSIFMLGGCWASIPIYRMFCEDTSYGGALGRIKRDEDKIDTMTPVKDRLIRIKFNADAGGAMYWKFKPLQDIIYVHPGETALAFFTATNPTDKPIIGVSTYNIIPYEAAAYFNKIQCFCFDEQLLNPGEQVDLPVFFYLDPDFAFDPMVAALDEVILSYTFFQSKANVILKRPTSTTQMQMPTLAEVGENVQKNVAVGSQLTNATVA